MNAFALPVSRLFEATPYGLHFSAFVQTQRSAFDTSRTISARVHPTSRPHRSTRHFWLGATGSGQYARSQQLGANDQQRIPHPSQQ